MGTTEKTESESTQSPLMVSDMKGTAQAYSPKNQPDLSSEWRIAGRFSKDGKSWIILQIVQEDYVLSHRHSLILMV
nr:hypothetical protein [Escherichia coli]